MTPNSEPRIDELFQDVPADVAAREAFNALWSRGYDGRDLAFAFVRAAVRVAKTENFEDDLLRLRDLIT